MGMLVYALYNNESKNLFDTREDLISCMIDGAVDKEYRTIEARTLQEILGYEIPSKRFSSMFRRMKRMRGF